MVEGQPFSLDLGDGVRLDLVWIVPGQFEMGAGGRSRGRPVTVSRGFWMGRCEVSNRQYQRFVAAAAYTGPRDGNARHLFHFTQQRVYTGANYPIIWVNWMNANSFCNWLTTQAQSTGQLPAQGKVRLPADAEWEYACRAGTRTSYYNGDRASDLSRIAWWEENCGRHGPKAVGLKEPNAWGLCDMLGNAAEWVQERVLRGGAWDFEAEECTSRYRRPFDPTKSEIYTGFRIVVSLN
jgi:formylglycine-generating enzyme required for sulfatase activity